MSPDLSAALHDAVDRGPQAPAPLLLDTARLASRVRRRRAVRAGVRGTVGVGAAGALAVAGVHVVRGADGGDGLPAAVPGADPGTCGSSVEALGPTGGDLAIELGTAGPGVRMRSTADESSRTALGTLQGRELTVSYATVVRAEPDAAAVAQLVDDPPHVVLAHDGVVVSAPARVRPAWLDATEFGEPDADGAVEVESLAGPGELVLPLDACPGAAEALPAGDYEVYAYVDRESGGRVVAGPWDVTLLEPDTTPVPLPAGFPADIPYVRGGLVEAVALDGTTASGWLVTVRVAGTDGLQRAVTALADAGFVASAAEIAAGSSLAWPTAMADDRYVVELTDRDGGSGDHELTYRVRER